jgi:hypothetical protein
MLSSFPKIVMVSLGLVLSGSPFSGLFTVSPGCRESDNRGELVFPGPADGANPIAGEIFKRRVGGNISPRVTVDRFVEITADSTLVVLHV